MSMPKHNMPAGKLALYEKLITTHSKIKRKGAANPYTPLNGQLLVLQRSNYGHKLRLGWADRVLWV